MLEDESEATAGLRAGRRPRSAYRSRRAARRSLPGVSAVSSSSDPPLCGAGLRLGRSAASPARRRLRCGRGGRPRHSSVGVTCSLVGRRRRCPGAAGTGVAVLADSRPRRVERESEDEPDPERDRRNHDDQVVRRRRRSRCPRTSSATCWPNQESPGSPAARTQPPRIRAGRKPSRKTLPETLGQPHFVQPPSSWESAIVKPARGHQPEGRPVVAPSVPQSGRICVASHRRKPRPRRRSGSSLLVSDRTWHHLHPDPARFRVVLVEAGATSKRPGVEIVAELLDQERSASSAKTCWTTPISRSLWNGRSTCSCETRLTETRAHDRAAHGEAERAVARARAGRTRTGRPAAGGPPGSRRSSTASRLPGCGARRGRRAPPRRPRSARSSG